MGFSVKKWRVPLVLLSLAAGLGALGGWTAPAGAGSLFPEIPGQNPARGEWLVERLGCRACHIAGADHGHAGPELDTALTRLTRAELETQLRTPRERLAKSRMPSFAFVRPEDFRALVAYLEGDK